MVSFLLGNRIFRQVPTTEADLEKVKSAIENIPIYVGIFERYEESMEYLAGKMDITWPESIEVKRMTLNRPKLDSVSTEVQQIIEECNPLDMALYNFCLSKLDQANVGETKIEFVKDRYGYIMKYTQRFNLLELYDIDKEFLKKNGRFFQEINRALHQGLTMSQGKTYVHIWNQLIYHTLRNTIADFDPSLGSEIAFYENDPLLFTEKMAGKLAERKKLKRTFMKPDKAFFAQFFSGVE